MKIILPLACLLAFALPPAAVRADDLPDRGSATVSAADQAQKPKEPPAETKIDITGVWALEVITMGGTGTPTVTLKQDGEKLSGLYSGRYGDAEVSGSIKGAEFTFSFMMGEEGNPVAVIYTGKVDKDTMKGTVSLGDMGDGTFTGKKK